MIKYRKSLSEIGWTEEQIIQYDDLAVEDHSYIAREERDRLEKSCVLKLNIESAQRPLNQRPDFVEAKREMKRLHDENVKETSETHPFILYNDRDSEKATNLKDMKNVIIKSMPETGWRTYPSKSRGNLSRNPTHSSSSTQWE